MAAEEERVVPSSFPEREDLELLEQTLRQTEDVLRDLANIRAGIRRVSGAGEAADGMVRATADGRGRITGITLNPRTMRLSAEALSREVTKAVQGAQDAAAEQAEKLLGAARSGPARLPEALDETFVRYRFDQVAQELE
ncbi:YbaB/EbfC family nucleoid-associated protein [Thermostaphylospora chromogena]|uniref:Conserved DNA-binding protein YbaB n=1 Tax=Thermostaphylospora chromogena TaxID=35622 RepID=A0A1H1C0T1_9ACTN|nr:YbaB/EbfC family nucleoid-associated protein [Thermostaphylospora chromogena]SDQ57775.1 Conserved DNA-binding protein YbaB [Thermostaphylospora chromogena]